MKTAKIIPVRTYSFTCPYCGETLCLDNYSDAEEVYWYHIDESKVKHANKINFDISLVNDRI